MIDGASPQALHALIDRARAADDEANCGGAADAPSLPHCLGWLRAAQAVSPARARGLAVLLNNFWFRSSFPFHDQYVAAMAELVGLDPVLRLPVVIALAAHLPALAEALVARGTVLFAEPRADHEVLARLGSPAAAAAAQLL